MKQIIQILVYNFFKKNDWVIELFKVDFLFRKKKEEINQIFVYFPDLFEYESKYALV